MLTGKLSFYLCIKVLLLERVLRKVHILDREVLLYREVRGFCREVRGELGSPFVERLGWSPL